MRGILRAALFYFAIVFAAGFALGTLRVLLVAPAAGDTAAILAELPIMLGLSWYMAGRLIRTTRALADAGACLAMGVIAFGLLFGAELALAVAMGQGPVAYLGSLVGNPGLLGFAGQIGFAIFPLIRRLADGRKP